MILCYTQKCKPQIKYIFLSTLFTPSQKENVTFYDGIFFRNRQ